MTSGLQATAKSVHSRAVDAAPDSSSDAPGATGFIMNAGEPISLTTAEPVSSEQSIAATGADLRAQREAFATRVVQAVCTHLGEAEALDADPVGTPIVIDLEAAPSNAMLRGVCTSAETLL